MLRRIGICELHEDTKITEDTYQVVVDRHSTHIEQYRTSANERSYLRTFTSSLLVRVPVLLYVSLPSVRHRSRLTSRRYRVLSNLLRYNY
jgi:hypothetical protein